MEIQESVETTDSEETKDIITPYDLIPDDIKKLDNQYDEKIEHNDIDLDTVIDLEENSQSIDIIREELNKKSGFGYISNIRKYEESDNYYVITVKLPFGGYFEVLSERPNDPSRPPLKRVLERKRMEIYDIDSLVGDTVDTKIIDDVSKYRRSIKRGQSPFELGIESSIDKQSSPKITGGQVIVATIFYLIMLVMSQVILAPLTALSLSMLSIIAFIYAL